jgi:hypothetical protein
MCTAIAPFADYSSLAETCYPVTVLVISLCVYTNTNTGLLRCAMIYRPACRHQLVMWPHVQYCTMRLMHMLEGVQLLLLVNYWLNKASHVRSVVV